VQTVDSRGLNKDHPGSLLSSGVSFLAALARAFVANLVKVAASMSAFAALLQVL
jgi:hypothetical protein